VAAAWEKCGNTPLKQNILRSGNPAGELSEIHAAPARTWTKLVFQQVDKEQHGGREDSREFPDCCLQILAGVSTFLFCREIGPHSSSIPGICLAER